MSVGDFVRGAVNVPDYAGIPEGFATEHGVVEGGLDVVGYQDEIFEAWVFVIEDVGVEPEGGGGGKQGGCGLA